MIPKQRTPEGAGVLQPHGIRLASHLEAPAARLDHLPAPGETGRDLRSAQPPGRLHIDHERTGTRQQQEIRDVPPHNPIDPRRHQERLRHDPGNRPIEVGIQKPGRRHIAEQAVHGRGALRGISGDRMRKDPDMSGWTPYTATPSP